MITNRKKLFSEINNLRIKIGKQEQYFHEYTGNIRQKMNLAGMAMTFITALFTTAGVAKSATQIASGGFLKGGITAGLSFMLRRWFILLEQKAESVVLRLMDNFFEKVRDVISKQKDEKPSS